MIFFIASLIKSATEQLIQTFKILFGTSNFDFYYDIVETRLPKWYFQFYDFRNTRNSDGIFNFKSLHLKLDFQKDDKD